MVLPTFNRCPCDIYGADRLKNPLVWALETLLAQNGRVLREIIVIDDGSVDFTHQIAEAYLPLASVRNVKFKYVRQSTNLGLVQARNTGIAHATEPVVVFGDDDCIYPKEYIWGALYCLEALKKVTENCFVITLPFYYRSTWPKHICPTEMIGRIDFENGDFHTNFHCVPVEYFDGTQALPADTDIMMPFPTQLINGTCAAYTGRLKALGGFPDVSRWPNAYSEHLALSALIIRAGGQMFHCPDPRLGACHLKYGTVGRYDSDPESSKGIVEGLGLTLADLISVSMHERTQSGCRIEHSDFYFSMIGSLFAFFLEHNLGGAHKYAVRLYNDFVVKGIGYSLAISTMPTHKTRREIWRNALQAGAIATHEASSDQPADAIIQTIQDVARLLDEEPFDLTSLTAE